MKALTMIPGSPLSNGDFTCWIQHRQIIDGQNITEYDPKDAA